MPKLYSWLLLFILCILSQVIIRVISEIILNIPDTNSAPQFENPISFFLAAVVVAPLIETLIFQCGICMILENAFDCKTIGICICSAIIFGLFHQYSTEYVIVATLIGFLLQLWYIIYFKKYGWKYAFLLIALAHSLNNSIGFFEFLFKYFY